MEKEVKCGICGKVFVTDKPNKKYCSFVCREAAVKLKRIRWNKKNPGYYKQYYKDSKLKETINNN